MADLTNNNVKMNFQLAVFSIPDTYDLDPSVKTRREKRLKLGPDMTSDQIQVDQKYYTVLNTQAELKGDFSVAYWYDDQAIVHVESQVVRIKRVNTATQVALSNVIRGRMHPITYKRFYPGAGDAPEGVALQPFTWNNYKTLQYERQEVNYLSHKYLAAISLKFSDKFKGLADNTQLKTLTSLDKYASEVFPGAVESVLLDTPLGKSDAILLVYFNYYLELNNYVSMLKTQDISNYLDGGFGEITICNRATKQQLESLQSMIRANRTED